MVLKENFAGILADMLWCKQVNVAVFDELGFFNVNIYE